MKRKAMDIIMRKQREPVRHWVLTEHLCRHCGTGTIMRLINGGPSAGGNPYHECSSCGMGACDIQGATPLCYCGWMGPNHEPDQLGRYFCYLRSEIESPPEGWEDWRLHCKRGVLRRVEHE